MSRRSLEKTALLLVLALAFFLRVIDLGRNSLWYDELLQVRIAQASLSDLLPELAQHAAMPLDYLVERVMLWAGTSEFILRFPAAAFSTMAVAAMYRLGKLLFGSVAGWLGAAFLAVSSFAIQYAREARPYSLYLLLVLASFYWLYRALQTNRLAHWAAYAVCIMLAVLAHLFALFVVIAQALFLAVGLIARVIAPGRARLFGRITRAAVVGVMLMLALVAVALAFTPYFNEVIGSAQRFVAFLLAPSVPPPEQWSGLARGESPPLLTLDFFYTRILEFFSGGGAAPTSVLFALSLLGLAEFRRKPWEIVLLLIWAIIPAALVILFLIHRATLFAGRYLIEALPAVLLLAAVGTLVTGRALGSMSSKPVLCRAALAAVALFWLALSIDRASNAVAATKENWRAAGQFLDANVRAGDAVLAPGGSHLIYFYAPRAERQHVPAELAPQIIDVENHHRRVWLVLNRYVFDPGGEIQAWVEGRGAVEFRVDNSIDVYYWRAGADHTALLDDLGAILLPATSSAYAALGEQFAAARRLSESERFYVEALSRAGSRTEVAEVNTSWGNAERRAGNLDRAAVRYRAALAQDSTQVDAWVGLARVYLEQGQLTAGRDGLNRALALDSTSYEALFFLAEYYERSGQNDAAQQAYARAAQIVPDLIEPP